MESRKSNFNKRPRKAITNSSLSNVHCQDESATTSPLKFPSDFTNQIGLDFCNFDVTETLPSDWLSDYPSYRKEKSSSIISSPFDAVFNFSKAAFLNDADESSRGSDSGLGSESLRSKSKSEVISCGNLQSSVEGSSSRDSQFSSHNDSLDIDDGFSDDKENGLLTKSNTTNLDFSSPFRNMKHINLVKKDRSPFNLHRRRCSTLGNSDNVILTNESRGKRFHSIDDSKMDDENILSTTPKRVKSTEHRPTLKRSLSSHPSLDIEIFRSSEHRLKPQITPTKQTDMEADVTINVRNSSFSRCHSEIPITPFDRIDEKKVDRVIEAIDNFSYVENASLIHHLLPTSDRQRFELSSVQAEDVANLLLNECSNSSGLLLIDCRYPYEYSGGHVISAVNIHSEDQVLEQLFYPALKRTEMKESCCFAPKDKSDRMHSYDASLHDNIIPKPSLHSPLQCMKNHVNQSCILIFYCEFSSRRAPNLAKFLRGIDRKFNLYKYPYLFYPEIYIMSGGYHNFVQKFNSLCEPNGYVKMFDKRFASELGKYKRKTRKLRTDKCILKRSPISPLRLEQDGNRSYSSPSSPPHAITWS